jgi:hypothetical protein
MEPGAALVSQDENRWTETAGVVQQVLYRTDCVTLQLSSTGGVVQAFLPGRDSVPPRLLLDSKVVIRGVGRKIFRTNLARPRLKKRPKFLAGCKTTAASLNCIAVSFAIGQTHRQRQCRHRQY